MKKFTGIITCRICNKDTPRTGARQAYCDDCRKLGISKTERKRDLKLLKTMSDKISAMPNEKLLKARKIIRKRYERNFEKVLGFHEDKASTTYREATRREHNLSRIANRLDKVIKMRGL